MAATPLDLLTDPPPENAADPLDSEDPNIEERDTGTIEEVDPSEQIPEDQDDFSSAASGSSPFDRVHVRRRRPQVAIMRNSAGHFVPVLIGLGEPVTRRLREAVLKKAGRLRLVAGWIAAEYADELTRMEKGEKLEVVGRLVQKDIRTQKRDDLTVSAEYLSKVRKELVELPDGSVVTFSLFFRGLKGTVNRADSDKRIVAEALRLVTGYRDEPAGMLASHMLSFLEKQRIPIQGYQCHPDAAKHTCAPCRKLLAQRFTQRINRLRRTLKVHVQDTGNASEEQQALQLLIKLNLDRSQALMKQVTEFLNEAKHKE